MSSSTNSHHPGDGSTGPKTPAGKQRSSRNATVHGARSEKHAILPGESEEEFQAIRRYWFEEFKPATELETDMVEHLARRYWSFKRCDRLCSEAEEMFLLANPDLSTWTEQDHRKLQLNLRYRTTSERAYKSAWAAIETLRANRIKEPLLIERLKRDVHHNVKTGMSAARKPAEPSPKLPETNQDQPKWPIIRT
jgi:hypothetical protein